MKGHLRLTRRLFAILCALVVLNAGALPACADYEERTEPAEKTFETNAVFDDLEQKTESPIEGSEEIPKEEKNGQSCDPGKDTDSGNEPFQGKNDVQIKQNEPGKMTNSENEDDDAGMLPELGGDVVPEDEIHQNTNDQFEEFQASEEQKKTVDITDPVKEDGIQSGQVEDERKPADSGQNNEKTDEQEDTLLSELRGGTDEFTTKHSMLPASKGNDDIAEDTGAKTEEKGEEMQPQETALRNNKGDIGYTIAVNFPGKPTFPSNNSYVFAKVGNEIFKTSMTGNVDPVYFDRMYRLSDKPESIAIVDEYNRPLSEIVTTTNTYYIITDPVLDEVEHKYILSGYERQKCNIYFDLAVGTTLQDTYYVIAKRKGSGIAVAYAEIKSGKMGNVIGTLYNDSTFVIIKTDRFDLYTYTNYPASYPNRIDSPGSIGDSDVVFFWDSEPAYGIYTVSATQKKDLEEEERCEDGSVTITNRDQSGAELSGSTFKLYAEAGCTTEISSYTGGSFIISTEETELKEYLPDGTENNKTVTLYLKETAVPIGYQGDEGIHPVVISASIARYPDTTQNKIIIKTSYSITIDGLASASITNKQIKPVTENAGITVTNRDQNGAELSGSTFKLFAEAGCTTEINSYTGGIFTISTEETKLKKYLPDGTENNKTVTLYLKEMTTPTGYKGDESTHPVAITATIKRYPDEEENKIVVETRYVITIDGAETIDIENTKLTGTARADRTITIVNKDNSGNELSGSSFGLYSDGSCSTGAIAAYTGGRFTIGTNDTALTNYLPTDTGADNVRMLYLKQTAGPAGYDLDKIAHCVVITKLTDTYLDYTANKFITRTTYEITVDDGNTIDITNTKRTKDELAYGEVSVTAKDQDGAALDGLVFGLYPAQECVENTKIATFSKQSFAISTGLDALASHLPTGTGLENATTLYLKQTTAPAGYDADTAVHSVVITKTVKTDLVEESNTYVTTTAYGITIDGKSAVDITNRKRTGTDRKDGTITIIIKDNNGNELNGSSFGLYSDGSCSTAAIDIYTGGRFEIGTNETALTNYLPTETGEDHATTLYLKQKTVPAGYDADIKVHSIAITKAVSTDLVEVSSVYMYVTKTTYGIVIDDKNAIDITNTKRTKDERAYGEVSVTAKDQDGAALNGLAFGLYPAQECAEKTEIATFSGQSFAISTGLDALTSHLPTETGLENATTLYLKQTTSPTGYDADTAVHSVVITKTVKTDLDEESNTYVTTTAYGIMIDGGSAVDIINRKRTGTDRKDGSITIINKDNSGNELSGSSFGLYSDVSGSTAAIDNYTGGRFTISTNDTALTNCLPTETGTAHARTLYLKETEAPAGYDKETAVHTLVITKSIDTYFDNTENKYITRTTYGITVDGGSTINITNTKRTDEKRTYGSVVVTAKDQDGVALDGLTFGLYPAQECAENTKIATFSKQSFAISTGLDALANHLPTGTGSENATTLYLKQTAATPGYDADTVVYPVMITRSETVTLDRDVNAFITMITYVITVDGGDEKVIINRKQNNTNNEENTTNAGTEGDPNSDGNGADASSEGDGNNTNDGENEDQTTGENGKPTTDEENGNSAASAGTQDNTTGGKDGNDSGIKTNQTRKESEKTQTNTGTASISSGETAKTNPAVQTVETDKRSKTDKSPSLTGTEVWRRKTNPGKTKAAAGKRENVIADSVENGWLVSVLQEAIRILAKAVDLLSTIIRTSFPAFLK